VHNVIARNLVVWDKESCRCRDWPVKWSSTRCRVSSLPTELTERRETDSSGSSNTGLCLEDGVSFVHKRIFCFHSLKVYEKFVFTDKYGISIVKSLVDAS
jgi:hypothetical protein